MRNLWIAIGWAAFAAAWPTLASSLGYAPEDAIRYTLSGSLGRGQEGPGAGVELGFHFGHLMLGASGAGAAEIELGPRYPSKSPSESHAEWALLVGFSHIDRLLFLEMNTGLSLSLYQRRGAPILSDPTDCPSSLFDDCSEQYEMREETPWGLPLEFSLGMHAGPIGLGFALGANVNHFAPGGYAMLRIWSGFDRRFSGLDKPKRVLGRIVLGPGEYGGGGDGAASVSPGNRTVATPFLSGAVSTLQGLGLWIEKRWEYPHVYFSAGGGSSYELGEFGDPKAGWTVFPALQVGHAWGRARRVLTLSTGAGLFAGRDRDDGTEMFAFNVPVQLTYLYRFRAFAPGLIGGLLFNEPRAGYFLGLVSGF